MSRRLRRVVLCGVALLLFPVALFGVGVLWPLPDATPVNSSHPFAFVGVTLIDVEQGIALPNRTVFIDQGRIAAVASEGALVLPEHTGKIDARGMFLMPALWDMHTHVLAISPLLDLPLYIAHGVTNVRDMQGCPTTGDPFIACAGDKRRWTEEAQQGRRVGPRVIASTSFMANGPEMLDRLSGVPTFYGTRTPDEPVRPTGARRSASPRARAGPKLVSSLQNSLAVPSQPGQLLNASAPVLSPRSSTR